MADSKLTALPSATTLAAGDVTYVSQGGVSKQAAISTIFTPTARTSGSTPYLTITAPADTTLTASTEAIGLSFVGATRQHATGALTTQREWVITPPTYSFAGASTITTAVTFEVTGAPVAGTNATITNKYVARFVAGTAAEVPLTLKAAASQTGNVWQVVRSNDVVMASLSITNDVSILTLQGNAAGSGREIVLTTDPGGYNSVSSPAVYLCLHGAFGVIVGSATSGTGGITFIGPSMLVGRNLSNFSISHADQFSDVVARTSYIYGGPAYTSASTNVNGGAVGIVGGPAAADSGKTGVGGSAYVCGGVKSPSGTDGNVLLNHDGSTSRGHTLVYGWLRQQQGNARLTANVTNATATMSNLTDLTQTLIAGRKYTGFLLVFASNDVGAEGLAFDFDGGTATMTSFAAAIVSRVVNSTLGVTRSTALATDLTATDVDTSTQAFLIAISMVVNAAGTFIPRFSEVTHTTGTATAYLGSFLQLLDSVN